MYISTFNLRNISTSKCCHQHINVHLSMRSPNQLQLWPTIHLRCTAVPRDVKTAARRHLQGSLIWMNHESDDLDYPLVMTNSLPWYRWPIEIDGLPINSMVDLSMAMLNNQMVIIIHGHGPEMLGYLGIIWDNHINPESRLMFSWMTSQTHEGKQQHRRLSRSFLLQETLEP